MGAKAKSSSLQVGRDRRLVKQILAGDQRAFHNFVNVYLPRLNRYAQHRLIRESDVNDAVQITLSQAARKLESYRGEATLLTWLIQICRHEISKNLHKAKQQADLMKPFLSDDLLRSVVESIESEPIDDPVQNHRRQELITLIQFTLDQLPERYAKVLELKYTGTKSTKQSATLSVSPRCNKVGRCFIVLLSIIVTLKITNRFLRTVP